MIPKSFILIEEKSKNDIVFRCEHERLIEGYCNENIQTCSYDLRMGSQYYYDKNDGSDVVNICSLQEGEVLKIPPDAICYVITEESVNMPKDLTASISLSLGLIKCGVMLAAQPPYDPGYTGKTVALLHNLSNEPVKIKHGQHILNIVFTKLSTSVDETQKYNGEYQKLDDLKKFCQEVRVGAVFELKQELAKRKERFNDFVPNVLTAITVVIAVLTVLFTILIGVPSVGGLWKSSLSNDETINTSYPEFSIDEEKNTLTICIDGQYYEIDLRSGVSQTEEGSTD